MLVKARSLKNGNCKGCPRIDANLDALTYIDVFRQHLVGHAVLVEDVVVGAVGGGSRTEKEAEHSKDCQLQCAHRKSERLTLHEMRRPACELASQQ